MSPYVPRALENRLRLYLQTFPVVLIVGPRQCGKSTFVHHELPDHRQFDLERPADYDLISGDVELFFMEHPGPLWIDEAQRLPELFPALRYVVDRKRVPGRIVLTGSAGPSLLRTAAESLAGRLGVLELAPFGTAELAGRIPWPERWWWGGMPPLYEFHTAAQRRAWIGDYLTTILERDLPQMGVRVPAPRLRALWTMLTHVSGGLLNVANIASSLQMAAGTINHYLDILEGALVVTRLAPYFANIGKRLAKRPKLYVRDTGILHYLAGLRRRDEFAHWPGRGPSFEALVVEELTARAAATLDHPAFYYWRTLAGAEVDLLVVDGSRIYPVEVKHSATIGRHAVAGLRQMMADLQLDRGYVISRSTRSGELGGGIQLLPWDAIAAGEALPWETRTG